MIVDLFYSALFIGLGIGLIKYRKNVKGWTGSFIWAEQYLGRGGTYFIIFMIGCYLIFLGVTYPFGGIEGLTSKKENTLIENPSQ